MEATLLRNDLQHYATQVSFADVKVRLIAFLIDNIIFCFSTGTVLWLVYFQDIDNSPELTAAEYVANIQSGFWFLWQHPLLVTGIIASHWLYYSLAESSARQATPGKFFLHLKVTCTGGRRVSFGRASLRYFGKLVSLAPALLGLWTSYYSAKKQMLHDKLSNCQLIVAA